MFKSLRVRNFQSHEDSILEFHKGLNVIVGSTFSGKTALFRAIYWLWQNRPTTTGFIRKASATKGKRGADRIGTAQVDLVLLSGDKEVDVSRIRGHEVNEYICGGEKHGAVGKNVPEEVTTTLNIGDINIQRQREYPFLLFDSPGHVASTFNRFTNLDKVEAAIGVVSSDIRSKKQAKATAEKTSVDLKERIAGFSYLKDLEELVVAEEEILVEIEKADTVFETLIRLSDEVAQSQTKIAAISEDLQVEKDDAKKARKKLEKAKAIDEKLSACQKEADQLSDCLQRANDALSRIDEIKGSLPAWKKELELQNVLVEIEEELGAKQDLIGKLEDVRDQLAILGPQIDGRKDDIHGLKEELAVAKKELKKVDTCPICTSKLTTEKKKIMLENLK